MTRETDLSRRMFMGVAGGVIGASALAASMSFAAGQQENKPQVSADDFEVENHDTDVLVIGGGFAGVFAAIKAHDAGANVTMVVKGRMGTSGLSPFAKGAFEYKKGEEDISIDEYVEQMSESSIQTSNPVFVRQLAEHSQEYIKELRDWGFFKTPLLRNAFMVPISQRDFPIVEQVMITHLIKEQGRIVGASGFSFKESKIHHFKAKTVILCTGSGGFKPNGFPMCDMTHDGTIMAYKLGAVVTGKEWNDGHGGSEENSGSCYDNWHGQIEGNPELVGPEVRHDLGVNSNYTAYTEGGPVTMGPPGMDGEGGPMGPPGGDGEGRPMGPPPGMDGQSGQMGPPPGSDGQTSMGPPSGESSQQEQSQSQYPDGPYIPTAFAQAGPPGAPGEGQSNGLLATMIGRTVVAGPPVMGSATVGGATAGMAIHKAEGLVPVDINGQTTLPGLYAAGDALGSYTTGGIYGQGGASATGSSIQGGFSGKAAAAEAKEMEQPEVPDQKLRDIEEQILAPLKRSKGYNPAWVTQVLQGVMIPNFVLYIKKERQMDGALAFIEELRDHHIPMLIADDLHKLRLAHETENMIITAEMKLKASMMRKESRLSHYRLDYPDVDYENWQAWINIHQGDDGEMVFTKQPFDAWPKLS